MSDDYALDLTPKARQWLAHVSAEIRTKIGHDLWRLQQNPLRSQTKAVAGAEGLRHFRAGYYRVIYTIDFIGHEVVVLGFARLDTYRKRYRNPA